MTTYVCGHRNPDTDSIVAAISYSALYGMLGENDYVPVRLGHLNEETKFLLNRFGFQPPLKISSVRTQVRDLEFDTPPRLAPGVPVSYAWTLMQEYPNLSVLPITNEDDTLYGLIAAGTIAQNDMQTIQTPVVRDAPVLNVLSALEGRILNAEDDFFDSISGEVTITLPGGVDAQQDIRENSIVLCGDQPEIVNLALERKAKCVILCRSSLGEKYRGIDSETCIISSPLDAWRAARLLYLATPVGRIARMEGDVMAFHLEDYLDDVKDAMLKSRYRSYPILDRQDKVVGTMSRYHLLQPRRKRIVLVDHNELGQSVAGLDQAEVVAVVDHHRLADIQTGYPVYVRNEPVGSTNTIIATMFQEHGLMPGEKLAGLMAAAIISDTVMFKSPTTTPRDRRMAERLAKIAGLDLDKLGQEVFSASSSDKPADALIGTDLKEFNLGDHNVIISQITTMDSAGVISKKQELLAEIDRLRKERKADLVILMVTDVLREGSDLLFAGDGEAIRQAFELQDLKDNQAFIPGLVSRKKQMVPALTQLWG